MPSIEQKAADVIPTRLDDASLPGKRNHERVDALGLEKHRGLQNLSPVRPPSRTLHSLQLSGDGRGSARFRTECARLQPFDAGSRRFRSKSTRSTPSSSTANSARRGTRLLFLPGEYHVDVPVGFYTQVLGLGATPDAVHIMGNVHSDASLPHNNATCTFWRAAEGFLDYADRRHHAVGCLAGSAFSAHACARQHRSPPERRLGQRRMDVRLSCRRNVGAGPQQQWISRNSEWGSWTGANWNMVFVGVPHPPAGEWPSPPFTKIDRTPIVREKPFLEVDSKGNWSVRIPVLRSDSAGVTWHAGATPGKVHPACAFLHRAARRRHGSEHQHAVGAGQGPALYAGQLRSKRAHSRDEAEHRRDGSRLCDIAPDAGHCRNDDGRCGWHRDCRVAFRRRAGEVAQSA